MWQSRAAPASCARCRGHWRAAHSGSCARRPPGQPVRMVAVSDFSGLMSSACALAKADASAATVSLDRGMDGLALQHIKTHRPRFRAFGFYAMPDGLLGILGHQGFELALCPFVVEKCASSVAEERGELRPGI